MNATEIKQKLIDLDACREAREWADRKTLSEIWGQCPRGDWMLWLARRAGVDKRTMTAAYAAYAAYAAAASAAYDAAADDDAYAARKQSQIRTAEIVRSIITIEMLQL